MKIRRAFLYILLAAVLALAFSGCGKKEKTPTPGTNDPNAAAPTTTAGDANTAMLIQPGIGVVEA